MTCLLATVQSDPLGLFSWIVLLLTILRWPLRLVLIPIILHRHRPTEALAWLVILFFEPFIGLAIYLVVGRVPANQKRIKRRREYTQTFRTEERFAAMRPFIFEPDKVEHHHQDLVNFTEELTSMPIVTGNSARIITSTPRLMKDMAEAVDKAEHHVHLMTFILVNDTTVRPVVDALHRAAERGVKCRVLIDYVGSKDFLKRHTSVLEHPNIELRASIRSGLLRLPIERLDVRNHRKILVIDGALAYVGSHNIVDASYGTKHHGNWHDLTAVLRGPVVLQIQQIFLEDWACEGPPIDADRTVMPEPATPGRVPMLAVPSGPGDRSDAARQLFIAMINEANDQLTITSPYLVPDEASLLALKLAAKRGVHVRLVVPKRSNHWIVQLAATGYYDELAEAGAEIHLHTPGVIHAKTLTIDEHFAMIGSANFDRRSFELNFELNMFLVGAEVTEKLRKHQLEYINQSTRLDLSAWRRRSRARQLAEQIAKLMGPLL